MFLRCYEQNWYKYWINISAHVLICRDLRDRVADGGDWSDSRTGWKNFMIDNYVPALLWTNWYKYWISINARALICRDLHHRVADRGDWSDSHTWWLSYVMGWGPSVNNTDWLSWCAFFVVQEWAPTYEGSKMSLTMRGRRAGATDDLGNK